MAPPIRQCPLCDKQGIKVCAGCSKVGYCSKEHQKEDWKQHKLVCEQKHKTTVTAASSATSSVKEEVNVTWADQQRINQFSRLNTQSSNLTDRLTIIEKDLANLNDACESLETLIDDDAALIKIGEVYVQVPNEEAEEWSKIKKTTVEEEQRQLKAQVEEIQTQMAVLKKELYGKFGKAINLENAEQTVNE